MLLRRWPGGIADNEPDCFHLVGQLGDRRADLFGGEGWRLGRVALDEEVADAVRIPVGVGGLLLAGAEPRRRRDLEQACPQFARAGVGDAGRRQQAVGERGHAGHRRFTPDKAYDHRHCRGHLTRRGIKVRIARCEIESSDRLGRHRWKADARSPGWPAAGGYASAATGTPSGSSPSSCSLATGCATTGCPAEPPPDHHDPSSGMPSYYESDC